MFTNRPTHRPLMAGARPARWAGVALALAGGCLGLQRVAPSGPSAVSTGASAAVVLPTSRVATPVGRITALRSFPTGLAVSPDGGTLLAIAGPTINGGSDMALASVDSATGQLRQLLPVSDAFGSVLFHASGTRAFVAGGTDGGVHVIAVGAGGTLTRGSDFATGGFASGLALSPTGDQLWVAEPNDGLIERLDSSSGARLGGPIPAPSPYQLAFSPDGATVYATAWRGSALSAVDVATGKVRQIPVGTHPTGVVVLPDGRVVTANSADASLSTFDPRSGTVARTGLAQIGEGSDSPDAIVAGQNGRLYVALAGDNAVAVLDPQPRDAAGPWKLSGLIPTGWYPDGLALSPDGTTLDVLTARGLAHSAAATQPYLNPDPAAASVDGAYATVGTLESVTLPNAAGLAAMTTTVQTSLRPAVAGRDLTNPVLAGRHGPIKHVIYVTRENKTYDMDLGDLHPGPGNALVLFGQTVTPNLHALERQFAEAQNFTYEGFASVVGHMWEDAGQVSDVYEKSVASTTGSHFQHLSDSWRDPTNYPSSGLLVEQAWKAGRTIRTYNEELAQQSGLLPSQYQASPSIFPNYDLRTSDVVREQGWEGEFNQFERHACTSALGTTYGPRCQLPDLEYVYLGNDHTTVVNEPGYPTVEAQVADNDYATAKLIEAVSHSPDWASTLVIVVEDDPQGTGDHVSAYRGLLALASPYVTRGVISTTNYDLTSAVAAIDRILGLPAISDYARTTRPLDDLFSSQPDLTPFVADSSGVQRYPFTPLPGGSPAGDPNHGISSFAVPDATDPAVANAATWQQIKHSKPPTALQ
jgi:YVTN family beta-propeller protein